MLEVVWFEVGIQGGDLLDSFRGSEVAGGRVRARSASLVDSNPLALATLSLPVLMLRCSLLTTKSRYAVLWRRGLAPRLFTVLPVRTRLRSSTRSVGFWSELVMGVAEPVSWALERRGSFWNAKFSACG